MICRDCAGRDHAECKKRNARKGYADCDCQHRVNEKTEDNNGDGKKS